MKKLLSIATICAVTATCPIFAQHTQSLSFSDPGPVTPGSKFTVSVTLTWNYDSFGLSYWLETNNALAPFLSITSATYFAFPDPNQTMPNPAAFDAGSSAGASPGFMLER